MARSTDPIGVFDSGLGGISVLRRAVQQLPGEDFLYYGDSVHAPYGTKPLEQVQQLTLDACELLLTRGAKAIVVACNTATSAAVNLLRSRFPDTVIIGTEPALKPAAAQFPHGRILVMATARTLAEPKFLQLRAQFSADIVSVPCSGLMEFVERGVLDGPELDAFLEKTLAPFLSVPPDAVVLGCTHYPFLEAAIRRAVGPQPVILDGSEGIARQLTRRLSERGLLNPRTAGGRVEFRSSLPGPEILQRCRVLLEGGAECSR